MAFRVLGRSGVESGYPSRLRLLSSAFFPSWPHCTVALSVPRCDAHSHAHRNPELQAPHFPLPTVDTRRPKTGGKEQGGTTLAVALSVHSIHLAVLIPFPPPSFPFCIVRVLHIAVYCCTSVVRSSFLNDTVLSLGGLSSSRSFLSPFPFPFLSSLSFSSSSLRPQSISSPTPHLAHTSPSRQLHRHHPHRDDLTRSAHPSLIHHPIA